MWPSSITFHLLQYHRGEGQVVRRPRDPLHSAGAGQRGGHLQHRAHHRGGQARQGPGLRGPATAEVLLAHRHGHRGLRGLLYVGRGE